MPTKNNYYTLPRPKREVFTKEFRDDEREDVSESISLRYLNVVEQLRAQEKASSMIEQFISGGEAYPAIGEEPAELTESLIRQACSIEAMQPPSADGFFFTAEELIAMAHTCPGMYLDITRFATEVNQGYDPKASGGTTTGPSLGPASTEEPAITPSF